MRGLEKIGEVHVSKLLTDDLLLSIFERISIIHRKRLSRVSKRWKRLIDTTLLWITTFSAVDDRRCITDWQPSNWLGHKFVGAEDYLRISRISASDLLSRLVPHMPNLRAIDLECCDMNSRILRTILNHCKKIERINLDSSIRLNFYSFNLMVQDWNRLRHLNLSCCSEVSEVSVRYIIKHLSSLESLNLCGTKIVGLCLSQLNLNLKRLDISYCWGVQEAGLNALIASNCLDLEELSVNNFDFDGSESCLIEICNKFTKLKHLQMSIGPCVAHDYFIDRLTGRGFSAISRLRDLESLIIEKICILDNNSLQTILKSCNKLKCLKLNLGWLNYCTDVGFANLDSRLPNLEQLHISYPASLTSQGISNWLTNMKCLKTLSIINSNVDNEIFKDVEKVADKLVELNFDDCRRITIRGLYHLIRIASSNLDRQYRVSLLGTGINIARVRRRKWYPKNFYAIVSDFKSPKSTIQLPSPVINF